MGLRDKYTKAVEEQNKGAWIELTHEDEKNSDGTSPCFCVRKASFTNKKHLLAAMRVSKQYKKKNKYDDNELLGDIDYGIDLFCETSLVDWKDFEPEEDGNKMDFNIKNAKKIFAQEIWYELYKALEEKLMEMDKDEEDSEEDAKN